MFRKYSFRQIFDTLSQYSVLYYSISFFLLFIFQFDIFKENVPKGFIINSVLVIVGLTLMTTSINKLIKWKDGPILPFIPCILCNKGKMQQFGNYVCNKCGGKLVPPK